MEQDTKNPYKAGKEKKTKMYRKRRRKGIGKEDKKVQEKKRKRYRKRRRKGIGKEDEKVQ